MVRFPASSMLARSPVSKYHERAAWALSGLSREQMHERSKTSATRIVPATGAMSYMMSKQQYLSDSGGNWHPHVMFFSPPIDPAAWGADVTGSPVLSDASQAQLTFFFIPVRKWSDGTLADYPAPAPGDMAGHHH